MFNKPFRVKSNNQLKRTERKKLCEEISKAYPTLTEEQIQNLIPKKEAISATKIVTHSDRLGKLYCVDRVPMFFELDVYTETPGLLPTVYTLWQHPDLLYSFTTRRAVVSKLAGGADLMLPGLVLNGPASPRSFGKLRKGVAVSVNTEENKAPVAVGITAHSSDDMYMSANRGKCVEIFHVTGDALCQLGVPPTRPDLGPPFEAASEGESLPLEIDRLEISDDEDATRSPDEAAEETETLDRQSDTPPALSVRDGTADPVREMDDLLRYCFLKACKTSVKNTDLPMLSSNFFKNHLLVVCPPGQSVDVKKSSYKKMSVFLASMKAQGVIDTFTEKGVESLHSIKKDHPLLRELVITEDTPAPEPVASNAPAVAECYRVTAHALPIMSKFGYEKGDLLRRAEVRKCFLEYLKKENLQDGKIVKLDPLLAETLRTKEHQLTLPIEDAINKFVGRFTYAYEVVVAGTKLVHTGKLQPIDITVATRSGNKKVTLVNDLETFGIKLQEFSKECQGIGASATITNVPGKRTPSVLVQGNQVLYVYKLLTEKYKINKNYIRGLQYAPKQKK